MRDCLRQTDALPHAFAVSGDFSVGSIKQTNALQSGSGQRKSFLLFITVNQQKGADEFPSRQSAWKRVNLRAITQLFEKLLRPIGSNIENRDAAARRPQQSGHQVHQRRLARAVWAHEAGDARLDLQANAVYAEYLAVELRDIIENDCCCRICHPKLLFLL